MRTFWLYCNRATTGGMNLIRALDGKRIKAEGNRFRFRKNRVVLNWGSSEPLPFPVKNNPTEVAIAVDKSQFFWAVEVAKRTAECVPATRDPAEAKEWLQKGHTVMARTILNGHSGAGIVIVGPKKGQLPEAKLYTRYIPKDEEYRIHIMRVVQNGVTSTKTIFSQKKVKRADFQGKPNRMIRCHDNGYTYQHTNLDVPMQVIAVASKVFGCATKLDWGAVDVIYCKAENKAYVLEINTAPGLDETTAKAYATAFKEHF